MINLDNMALKYYNVIYKHVNHSIFKAKIVAFSEANLTTQIESLIFQRYKRRINANVVTVVEISKTEYLNNEK
jgi:hypothetical protein